MGSFIACYVIVWVATTCYVAHLGAAQSSLRQRVDALQEHVEQQMLEPTQGSRAA